MFRAFAYSLSNIIPRFSFFTNQRTQRKVEHSRGAYFSTIYINRHSYVPDL